MWVLGYPEGSAAEVLDGTLNLRFFFLCVFPHGRYLELEMVIVKGRLLLRDIVWMQVVTLVQLTRKRSRCIFSCHSGSRASNAEERKRLRPPFLRRRGG